jgi:CBS-domain-containing membrane protein
MKLLEKMKGDGAARPPRPEWRVIALSTLGASLAITLLGWLTSRANTPLVLGSFGATCVMVFGFPDAPFAQPRHVLCGHVLTALIGLIFLHFTGPCWWGMGLATGTAIAAMMCLRIVHPPAGGNPIVIFMTSPSWSFIWFPTLSGALIIVALALIYNNLTRPARYPKYY